MLLLSHQLFMSRLNEEIIVIILRESLFCQMKKNVTACQFCHNFLEIVAKK